MPISAAKRTLHAATRVGVYRMTPALSGDGWLEATPVGCVERGVPVGGAGCGDAALLLSVARRWMNSTAMPAGCGLLGVLALESAVPGGALLAVRPSGDTCPTFLCLRSEEADEDCGPPPRVLRFRFSAAFEWMMVDATDPL